jgi:hypothetical protein
MGDFDPFAGHRSPHLFAVGSERDPYRYQPGPESYEPDDAWAMSRRADLFTELVAVAGGADALLRLDADPIPDEAFDWSTVDGRDAAFVGEVLVAVDECCAELLDVEFRTIARRILARVAARDPRALRRSTHVARCAAGLVWLTGRASGEFGSQCRLPSRALWSWFGVPEASDRGRSLQRAAGLEPDDVSWERNSRPTVGDPELLHSQYRAELIARRDLFVGIAAARRTLTASPDGSARVHAEALKPLTAAKGAVGNRAMILAGFGDNVDNATFFAFSITETRELVGMLQSALDSPMPRAAGAAPDGA